VYIPLALIVPVAAFPPATPSTDHVTAVLLNPVIVALNCCVPDGATVAEVGDATMVKTVTGALMFRPLLVTVAATVWLPACDGAVYKPVALTDPVDGLPPTMPSTDQLIEGFVTLGKLALNC
jgi:hypothetical protein